MPATIKFMDIEFLPSGKYVVAVSGGVDSVALLHMLQNRPGAEIVVAHFNHGIRDDSLLDKELVKNLAERYNLSFAYDEGNLGKNASEAQGRAARYNFLNKVRKLSHAQAIITAHHQDDLLETAIINWLRGTGRSGYTALKSNSHLIRPLLKVKKAELVDYAKQHKLAWREDSTNQDTKYLRNLVRQKVLPQLDKQKQRELADTLDEFRGLNDIIDQKLIHFLHTQPSKNEINRHWFTMLPHDVAMEVMAMWLRINDCMFNSKLLESLVIGAKTLSLGKRLDVDKTHYIEVRSRNLALSGVER